MIAIYSILHFIVDAICAYAMFGRFGGDSIYAYLLYNLCAFVLQLPIGAVIDLVVMRMPGNAAKKRVFLAVTALGVVLTLIGMYAGPYALGVGNALFHSGGGVGCINEDRDRKLNGRGLGVFVAPGALGLFVGKLANNYSLGQQYVQLAWIAVSLLMVLIAFLCLVAEEKRLSSDATDNSSAEDCDNKKKATGFGIPLMVVCCFIVVIIRSYVGMAMSFDWKNGLAMTLLAVLMVAFGKAAGGFAAARIGKLATICISLGLAGVAFFFSDNAIAGLLALFFFNMTMPITLHMMTEMLTYTPGIAFGSLSFGLFIGFLPVYFEWAVPVTGMWIGVAGSLLSLALLVLPIVLVRRNKGKR